MTTSRKLSVMWNNKTGTESVEDSDDLDRRTLRNTSVNHYLSKMAGWFIPGLGMFSESFMIFSTGQIKTLWKAAYPECWQPDKTPSCPNLVSCNGLFPGVPEVINPNSVFCQANGEFNSKYLCSSITTESISYTEFAGIMLGMLILSALADRLGRRIGSISTAMIMFIGGLAMALSIPFAGYNTMFVWFAVAFFVYGFGVGGEYPTSASSAAEKSTESSRLELTKSHPTRGRDVVMTFSMQGVGAVVGSLVILILLLIVGESSPDCNDSNNTPAGYSAERLNITWRVVYGIGSFITCGILIYRILHLKESNIWKDSSERRERKYREGCYKYNLSNPMHCYKLAAKYYWNRIVATAGCWFLWDIAFYGNKLFSGPIFASLVPDHNLININMYILLNNFVSLIGYYCAAFIIDREWCGRRKLQTFGFGMSFILFLLCGLLFDSLSPELLLFLYIFCSFWGQCGPNCTTFLTPTELYPVPMRATCHGISAFCGKAGALVATIAFSYLETKEIFLVCAAVSGLSVFFTLIFLPDVTQLHMIDNERYFEFILLGQQDLYQGEAKNPKYCSLYERWTGFCSDYDPEWFEKTREEIVNAGNCLHQSIKSGKISRKSSDQSSLSLVQSEK